MGTVAHGIESERLKSLKIIDMHAIRLHLAVFIRLCKAPAFAVDQCAGVGLGFVRAHLGFGCMRFPLLPGSETKEFFERSMAIDEEKANEMIEYALEHSINYFDSAYLYHGGKSETFLGKAIQR